MQHGVAIADVLAGMDAARALLGALVTRVGTGEGRAVLRGVRRLVS
jgi:crotonobetainyl-CoA:carnitine CoA-transferase CaiB-like acyl-CoA transferase